MNKFLKLFKAVTLIVKQPSLLNKILDDGEVNKKEVVDAYSLPKGLPQINIAELITDFSMTVNPYTFLDGTSSPLDLLLLKALAKKYTNCNYLEIGTWRGESVANVSSVAEKCTTINLPSDEMQQLGLSNAYIDLHGFFSKKLLNVKHIQANSLTFNFKSLNEKFNLIFIDGDHHFESVKSDTINAFELLKDENSIIVWHDYGNSPEDIRWDVLKGILAGTPIDKRKNLYRVSNTLCAIYTTQKINATFEELPQIPNKDFEISIHLKNL